MTALTVMTEIDEAGGLIEAAACVACEKSGPESIGVLICLASERPPQPTVLASGAAKETEGGLRAEGFEAAARGAICLVGLASGEDWLDDLVRLLDRLGDEARPVVAVPPVHYSELIHCDVIETGEILLRTGRSAAEGESPLLDLAVAEARNRCDSVRLVPKAPGWLTGKRALAGWLPGRGRLAKVDQAEERGEAEEEDPGGILPGDSGQATPMVLGAVFILVLGAMVLVAVGGAVTGKARAQRAVDLSALSAAKSMKNDLPRLLAPPTLPNGAPNPYHMEKVVYLMRARSSAVRIAVANGSAPWSVSVRFPDALSFAPVTARVSIRSRVRASERTGSGPGGTGGLGNALPGGGAESWAEARVSMPISMGSVPSMATGGGYSGPLAERLGEGMRPDVAAAFDQMAAAASAAGVTLTIASAFRSDAEQAALFAAHPDPTWVAPPGQSLHRCATELDLGSSDGFAWLVSNASRFGFVQRYSWEAWHYGFVAGPAPCSDAGNSIGSSGGDRSSVLSQSFPSVTPRWVKPLILRAALKWNVSAPLLAAQLFAESSFDPNAGNGIAFGIAAFTPAAAAEYGLENPFDPAAAIMAQAHLMSDLLKEFGSPALALAAYNAGAGAVGSCNCIPDYPETQAYVAKILGMLGGMGSITPMGMKIELVK